jgi:diaminopimelate epimerase
VALELLKAHAYGNDFLYLAVDDLERPDGPGLARQLCERHTGVGADGLILYRTTDAGAAMRLYNADGSYSEVSGNGVRGLAAVCCWRRVRAATPAPASLVITTDAGDKAVSVLSAEPPRFVCRTSMGHPADVRLATIDVGGTAVEAVVLRVGNPQCVVLEHALDEARSRRLGAALERHPFFPQGTNVEFACVEHAGLVRILIWERGVGPTMASGTGACAAAVAAISYGGADRDVTVASPGGSQRVEWRDDGLHLTGWAEVVWEGRWTR